MTLRRSRSRRWPVMLIGAVGALIGMSLSPVHAAHSHVSLAPRTDSDANVISLVAQPFNILTSVNATFTLSVPAGASIDNNDVIDVRLHRRVANRDSFRSIADGSAQAAVIDRYQQSLGRVRRDSNGRIALAVPIDTRPNGNALDIPFDGVFPLSIAIVDDATKQDIASVLTFINRREPGLVTQNVAATTVVNLAAPPALQPDGTVVVTDDVRAQVARLVAFLSGTNTPITVGVQPELIAALGDAADPADAQLFVSLREQLLKRSIVTSTFVPTDPAEMSALGLNDEWVEQLRLGTAILSRYLPGVPLRTDSLMVSRQLDRLSISLLRTAGISSLILFPDALTGVESESPLGVIAHPSGRDNEFIAVSAVDPRIAADLATPSLTPALTGYRAAAELLVARDDLVAGGVSPDWIRLVASTPTGAMFDDGVLPVISRALAGAPGITMTDMSSRQLVTSQHPALVFQPTIPDPGNGRRAALIAARTEMNAVVSMLAEDDPQREKWSRILAVGTSAHIDNATDWITAVRQQTRDLRRAVTVTTPGNITLASRNTRIRLQIRNDSQTPLTVRVRLASAKLKLTDPVQMVNLVPGAITEVVVPATTRTNGRFPITVRVTTPEGAQEVVPLIYVTARVNAIAGLGQLVSISLLMVLLAWWWSHRRKSRRRRDDEGLVVPAHSME